jgi:streptogramin lyase
MNSARARKKRYLCAGLVIGSLIAATAACGTAASLEGDDSPIWAKTRIVADSSFHTINGLTSDRNGDLLVASLASETIFRFDPESKTANVEVPPPSGASDDIAVSDSGRVFWTDPLGGVVRTRTEDGSISEVAKDLPGVNSIAFSPDGRLFVGQTFFADSFWEIYPDSHNPPRLVADKTGGVNAFTFGADGKIYGPVAHDGTVVRMDPENGDTEIVTDGLKTPVSVRQGPDDRMYVLSGATGELLEIDPQSKSTHLIAQAQAPADNMTVTNDDIAYVTSMADNAITAIDLKTQGSRVLSQGSLAFPKDISIGELDGLDLLYVADSTAVRKIDTQSGEISDVARRLSSPLQFPSGIDSGNESIYLASEITQSVQVADASTREFTRTIPGFDRPSDVLGLPNGDILVSEGDLGQIVRVTPDDIRTVIADGLTAPTGLSASPGGEVYVAESSTGRVLSIDLTSGESSEVSNDFSEIRSISTMPDGRLVVLESSSGKLHLLEPATGETSIIATDLPVGYLQDPYPRSGGVAVDRNGSVYVAADTENAIYKLTAS